MIFSRSARLLVVAYHKFSGALQILALWGMTTETGEAPI